MTSLHRTGSGVRAALVPALTVALTLLAAPGADAYQYYDNGLGSGCVECHTGFESGPMSSLHNAHTNNFSISTCNFCHPSGGGTSPVQTVWSGTGGGFGCAGCHGQDYGETSSTSGLPKASGYGLRQAHANAGVVVCAGCHAAPMSFLGEDVLPPYYGMAGTDLTDSCRSSNEDSAYDGDAVGLDNDGDGARDYPADTDCPEPPPTTTSTTTTTLPAVSCTPAPAVGCVEAAKGKISVDERSFGKEKLKLSMSAYTADVESSDIGDPFGGETAYAVCIYDDDDTLAGNLLIDRAGDLCNSSPCWSISGAGYKYGDKSGSADGVQKMQLLPGVAGKGKASASGKNNEDKGLTSLPSGIAAQLLGSTMATVQIVSSDAGCVEAIMSDVGAADGARFSAGTP